MRLSHASMYARVLAGDAGCNGQFFTGVLTTGIYCLPACKARKPKPENVRFFPTCEAARAAGLRPCRKCHPDDFARGADPVLDDLECLVREIRATPSAFADARAIVRRSGFGATRLFELFRQHFHTTPADLLVRARIEQARHALAGGACRGLEASDSAGFAFPSAFHAHFRRLTGLTPGAYRSLDQTRSFTVLLPAGFPLGHWRRALSRDPHSATERLHGERYSTVMHLRGGPAVLRLRLAPVQIDVEVEGGSAREAHSIVTGLLGLGQDAEAFSRLAHKLGLARLVAGREGLRLVQTPAVFDGLVWAILGQQISFPFACLLRRRLTERAGTKVTEELFAPPTPAAIAALNPADLLPLQFSRQKAGYLIAVSRLVTEGKLDLEALRWGSATRAERKLLAVRGLGPWSVNYILMRSLGFPDCVPLGDTGVTSGLQALLRLEERPDIEATRRLMAMFAPFRSLATAHLWQFNQPPPS